MPASVYVPSPLEISRPYSAIEDGFDTAPQLASVPEDDTKLRTIDGLVRHRALHHPNDHAVSYPSSGVHFVHYTISQIDTFAWRVAQHYVSSLPVRQTSAEKPAVVALLGPSNLEYLITKLALSKLGHTVLLLSTRIPQAAIESLLETTGACALAVDARYAEVAGEVQKNRPTLQVLEIARRSVFEFPVEAYGDTRMDSNLDADLETRNNAFIIHSSGSTGLPKPIYQPHKACLANYASSMNMKAFITLPLFHNHGICNLFRAVHSRKPIYLYNAELPLTQSFLVQIMKENKFEIFYGVPHALKLLSESEEGISLLRELRIVMYGGSACPDDLGNMLVDNGVNLVGHYGATEVGQLMTSFRPEGDKAWNYVREHDKLTPYLKWIPRGPNLYECCVTDGWSSKVQSNQPDGSYTTKDLFEPHPTIPRAWKYIARLDDTIVLVNGEKFHPVAMEGTVRSNRNITEAVVFGAGRPYLGILVVPSTSLADKPREAVLDIIWPVIEGANKNADAFARISRDMVRLLASDCEYPRTDKGSIIRQAFYKTFAREIEEAYDDADTASGNLREMNAEDLKTFLRDLLARTMPGKGAIADDTDFFHLGLDSLQAIQMRSEILKTVCLGGRKPGNNVVFEHPSIEQLAQHLIHLRLGQETRASVVEDEMQKLIDKYTQPVQRGTTVVVTGATGSLGAHVVAKLASNADIDRIYCLVRASDEAQAMGRVKESLIQRRLYQCLAREPRRKIVALPSDLSKPSLGLSEENYQTITDSLCAVIHCAWSVNFNMQLSSFEKDNIAGVVHLISLCRSSARPASMNFCSSVSTCSRATTVPVPESVPELGWAQGMGYAQSKTVAEHICARAASQGVTARVLRVGQIIGDTAHGVWNAQEAIPMMLQTALTVGSLPRLKETPSWLPVDTVAHAITDISLSDAGSVFTNITNPKTFDWVDDLLPALRAAGLSFDEVEPKEWVRRLRASNPDPVANPPIKLTDFFASKYDKADFTPSKPFSTQVACSLSPALANAPTLSQNLVNKFVSHFTANDWRVPAKAVSKRTVIVAAGPCGTGKSTVGAELAARLHVPFLEGDVLHTRAAVETMRAGSSLSDDDRCLWLDRICTRAKETLTELDYSSVVISCSALKQSYRAKLRDTMAQDGFRILFLDLQASRETLTERLENRKGHYMGAEMVDGQLAVYEEAAVGETDIIPIDAEQDRQLVVEEAQWVLQRLLKD